MSSLLVRGARLVTPEGIHTDTSLLVQDGRIVYVGPHDGSLSAQTTLDADGLFACAGFVDIHVHGGGGSDFGDGASADVQTAARAHLQHGTTALMPTLVAAGEEATDAAMDAIGAAFTPGHLPHMLGVHIEGPYIARAFCGALNPEEARAPSPAEYGAWLLRWPLLRRVTLAPELPGSQDYIRALVGSGRIASLGHSGASYADALAACQSGASLVTHLYSAMSSVWREGGFRIPGLLESALLLPLPVELIADGCHLPAELLRLVTKTKPVREIVLVTDAMRAAGTNQTTAALGARGSGPVALIEDGVAKLPDRSAFAGSIATADRLLRVITREAGVSLPDAVAMLTCNPAAAVGVSERCGRLAAGRSADIVLFDADITIKGVCLRGQLEVNRL